MLLLSSLQCFINYPEIESIQWFRYDVVGRIAFIGVGGHGGGFFNLMAVVL